MDNEEMVGGWQEEGLGAQDERKEKYEANLVLL